jgi:DNA invertase Pin-like site-specific DNA recombinase
MDMSRPVKALPNATQAIGYRRVSTAEQEQSGAGLTAQETAIAAACERRGLELVATFTDTASGAKDNRPGLAQALAQIGPNGAGVLVVSKQDRLSRSLFHFADLLEQAKRDGWSLVIADTDIDTRTPNGALVAGVMASIAQWERQRIAERTREALAVRKAAGVKLGRRATVSDDVRTRISELRAEGLSWAKITEALTTEGAPTGQGGGWHPTQVRRIWLADQAAA